VRNKLSYTPFQDKLLELLIAFAIGYLITIVSNDHLFVIGRICLYLALMVTVILAISRIRHLYQFHKMLARSTTATVIMSDPPD